MNAERCFELMRAELAKRTDEGMLRAAEYLEQGIRCQQAEQLVNEVLGPKRVVTEYRVPEAEQTVLDQTAKYQAQLDTANEILGTLGLAHGTK